MKRTPLSVPPMSARRCEWLLLTACLIAFCIIGVAQAQDDAISSKLDLVQANPDDRPRLTPITRVAMKQYLEDLKRRLPRIPLPEASEEDKQRFQEEPRSASYESRLRSSYLSNATNAYLTFGGSPSRGGSSNGRSIQPPDPALSLDYAFKVRLFWIAARANNCQYCLGHQESKLLAAGMSENEIAALDCDWQRYPENERAAFALAKVLTNKPYAISDKEIDDCRPYFSDLQLIEMIGSIAGNNAINRWKEGAGISQSINGGNFGNRSTTPTESSSDEDHSYLTSTDADFAVRPSQVAVIDKSAVGNTHASETVYVRPDLEFDQELAGRLKLAATRQPRLPLANESVTREVMRELCGNSTPPDWMRLLAHFPVAGRRFVEGVLASQDADQLDRELQLKIDWVVARQDGAWYITALTLHELQSAGVSLRELTKLDRALASSTHTLEAREQALLVVAQNLATSPIVLTDKQVKEALRVAGPRAVTQVINYTCYRAAIDRMTEAAGLAYHP